MNKKIELNKDETIDFLINLVNYNSKIINELVKLLKENKNDN